LELSEQRVAEAELGKRDIARKIEKIIQWCKKYQDELKITTD